MSKISTKRLLLFVLVIGLMGSVFLLNVEAKTAIQDISVTSNDTHELWVTDFTHFNKPIYVNYTVVTITVRLIWSDANLSQVYAHYSSDLGNWTTIEFNKTDASNARQVYFTGDLGPFDQVGDYYLKINATRISEIATLTYRFSVENVAGIIFVDFSYKVKTQSDFTEYADILINVLGDDIKEGTLYVSSPQQPEGENPFKLELVEGSKTTYKDTIGPINTWGKVIVLTFEAKTNSNVLFNDSSFYIVKSTVYIPEEFWTGKFPAIAVSVVVFGAYFISFFASKRKPPKNFDKDFEKKKASLKKEKRKKKKE
ncbi:MAG: hypothetical protein ACTSQB_01155 [Candidatus Heimdallarchaeota archaeon]